MVLQELDPRAVFVTGRAGGAGLQRSAHRPLTSCVANDAAAALSQDRIKTEVHHSGLGWKSVETFSLASFIAGIFSCMPCAAVTTP